MPRHGESNSLSDNPLPLPLGYECSGIVVEVGKKVTKVQKGDHVVVNTALGCLDVHRWLGSRLSHRQFKPCAACRKCIYNCCEHNGFLGLGVIGGAFAEKLVTGETLYKDFSGPTI